MDVATYDELAAEVLILQRRLEGTTMILNTLAAVVLVECDLAVGDPETFAIEQPLPQRAVLAVGCLRRLALGALASPGVADA